MGRAGWACAIRRAGARADQAVGHRAPGFPRWGDAAQGVQGAAWRACPIRGVPLSVAPTIAQRHSLLAGADPPAATIAPTLRHAETADRFPRCQRVREERAGGAAHWDVDHPARRRSARSSGIDAPGAPRARHIGDTTSVETSRASNWNECGGHQRSLRTTSWQTARWRTPASSDTHPF
jgi:hypothetical protein